MRVSKKYLRLFFALLVFAVLCGKSAAFIMSGTLTTLYSRESEPGENTEQEQDGEAKRTVKAAKPVYSYSESGDTDFIQLTRMAFNKSRSLMYRCPDLSRYYREVQTPPPLAAAS